jgi:hypothetical protein
VHLPGLGSYWWVVLVAMAAGFVMYVLVAGRSAEGGLRDRAGLGWQRWRALSKRTGEFQARVILTAFYFVVAAPFGLVRTGVGDPLHMKRDTPREWLPRQTYDGTLDRARRQS